MKHFFSFSTVFTMGTLAVLADPPPPPPADSIPITIEPQTELITDEGDSFETLRGPLHEAFAQPVNHDPEPPVLIPARPPEPLDEIPPEIRPGGSNVIWISGYWAWDETETDFLWISGVWRDVPPGRRWVDGYWTQVEDGFVWTPGAWGPEETPLVDGLPEPPPTQERGPTSVCPGTDHFWVPGNWQYVDNNYAWRPGFWSQDHTNWVWVPNCYRWTPTGYTYGGGYWDYAFNRRGVVYAPYRFRRRTPGRIRYRPSVALDIARLTMHLFVANRARRYVFGDYYGRQAYVPWYVFHSRRRGYSPSYAWYSRRYGRQYGVRLAGWNHWFTANNAARPPRTLKAQQRILERNLKQAITTAVQIGRKADALPRNNFFGRQMVTVSTAERNRILRSVSRPTIRTIKNTVQSTVRSPLTPGELQRTSRGIQSVITDREKEAKASATALRKSETALSAQAKQTARAAERISKELDKSGPGVARSTLRRAESAIGQSRQIDKAAERLSAQISNDKQIAAKNTLRKAENALNTQVRQSTKAMDRVQKGIDQAKPGAARAALRKTESALKARTKQAERVADKVSKARDTAKKSGTSLNSVLNRAQSALSQNASSKTSPRVTAPKATKTKPKTTSSAQSVLQQVNSALNSVRTSAKKKATAPKATFPAGRLNGLLDSRSPAKRAATVPNTKAASQKAGSQPKPAQIKAEQRKAATAERKAVATQQRAARAAERSKPAVNSKPAPKPKASSSRGSKKKK
jgi:hypothetical protein